MECRAVVSRRYIYWEKGRCGCNCNWHNKHAHRQQRIVALIGAAIRTNPPHFRPVFCPRFQQDCFHFLSKMNSFHSSTENFGPKMATPGGGGGGGTGDAEVAASPSLDGIIGSVEGALETLRKVSALFFLHFSPPSSPRLLTPFPFLLLWCADCRIEPECRGRVGVCGRNRSWCFSRAAVSISFLLQVL